MQVKVVRTQHQPSGLLGGKKPLVYSSTIRVDLSADEKEKVEKHGLVGTALFDVYIYNQTHKSPLELAGAPVIIKLADVLRGYTFESKSMGDVIVAQSATLDGCRDLQKFLAIIDTFNGAEMVFDLDKPKEEVLVDR